MKKILIIDDSSQCRTLLSEFINSADGLMASESEHLPPRCNGIDWILLELDFDCEQNCRQALDFIQENPGVNFVAMAGPGESHQLEEAVSYGIRDFLIKPFREQDLIRIMEKINEA